MTVASVPEAVAVIVLPTKSIDFILDAVPTTDPSSLIVIPVTPAPAEIPVNCDPLTAGNVDGNLASGIVPDDRFDAFKEDKSD